MSVIQHGIKSIHPTSVGIHVIVMADRGRMHGRTVSLPSFTESCTNLLSPIEDHS